MGDAEILVIFLLPACGELAALSCFVPARSVNGIGGNGLSRVTCRLTETVTSRALVYSQNCHSADGMLAEQAKQTPNLAETALRSAAHQEQRHPRSCRGCRPLPVD